MALLILRGEKNLQCKLKGKAGRKIRECTAMKTKVTDQERMLSSPRGEVEAESFKDRNKSNFFLLDICLLMCLSRRHNLFIPFNWDNPIKSISEILGVNITEGSFL